MSGHGGDHLDIRVLRLDRPSMSIGLHNLDQFAYIAAFSGGGNRAEWEKADAAEPNQSSKSSESKLKVLWIGCGTEDPGYNGVKAMDDLLTKKVRVAPVRE